MAKDFKYANYDFIPKFSYDIISNLIDNPDAEIIWKLLSGSDREDWNKQNLTKAEKRALIYSGEENAADFSIHIDSGEDDVLSKEKCYLRIYPYFITPKDPYKGVIDVAFEIICHYSINTLSNYQTRVDTIISALLKCLNGKNISAGDQVSGALGVMFFSQIGSRMDKMQNFNQPPFKGKILVMSVNAG